MSIVFMGTPEFAVSSLTALITAGEDVVAVVTQPDKPSGRGRKIISPPVKIFAQSQGLPVLQPRIMRDPEAGEWVAGFKPHLIVVAAYGQILPRRVLKIPTIAILNVHASLLPRYRGAAPINWAIIRGEKETGITIMRIVFKLDSGDILLSRSEPILPDDTAGTLHDRLKILGAECLLEALDMLRAGTANFTPQDDSLATLAPLLNRESARIDWSSSAIECHNFIRGMNPWPMAFTTFRGQICKINRSAVPDSDICPATTSQNPGRLKSNKNRLFIQCGDGDWIQVMEAQLPGRAPISGSDFINGVHPCEEDCFV